MTASSSSSRRPVLRRAADSDVSAMTALCICSKQSNGYDEDFMRRCEAELTVTTADLAKNEWWVAHTDTLVGCACLAVSDTSTSGLLKSFYVDPGIQRQGVGRLLWNRLRTRARELKLDTLVLEADPNAVAFYAALGFVVVGESASSSIAGRALPKMQITLGA